MIIKFSNLEIHLDMSKHALSATGDIIRITSKDDPEMTVTFKGIPHATQVLVDALDSAYSENQS